MTDDHIVRIDLRVVANGAAVAASIDIRDKRTCSRPWYSRSLSLDPTSQKLSCSDRPVQIAGVVTDGFEEESCQRADVAEQARWRLSATSNRLVRG